METNVLVYQMGKVGSVSVQVALKLANVRSIHAHYLLTTTGEYNTNKPPLVKRIASGEPFKVITLTREPISRNISAFFQGIHKYYPNYKNLEYSDEMVDAFLNNYNHNWVLNWFDDELNLLFDINVYRRRFPTSKGWNIYKARKSRILVIRSENLNVTGAKIIGNFTDCKINEIPYSNSTDRHERMSRLYNDFKTNAKFPKTYIDKMYNSKYAQYFYSKKELEEFRNKWL